VSGARAGNLAEASLVSSICFIELDATLWSNNTVRVVVGHGVLRLGKAVACTVTCSLCQA
jgi:hypothetical protein